MIPTPVNKLGEVDIQAKIKRSSYVLFGDKDLKTLSPVKAKQQVDSFKASLASLPSLKKQQRNTKNTLPWPRKITHWEDLKELSLQGLQEEFLTHYTLIEDSEKRQATSTKSKKDGDEGEFTQANNDEIKKCAFCDPKVIQNQFVYKFGDFVCLYNFRPYTPGYHFMITPYLPLHVENWQDFSLQDVLQIDQLAQAIVKSIKQESGQDDVVLFIQNGLAAGMTVPHSHMHVLLRPNKVHYYAQLLLEATGNKRKGLTSEEMDPVKTKFKNHLDKFLTIPNE
jgi:diadenosine tetraphosphate (Ap4A) HIT family hydrolase